jgi:hypothetical protein
MRGGCVNVLVVDIWMLCRRPLAGDQIIFARKSRQWSPNGFAEGKEERA